MSEVPLQVRPCGGQAVSYEREAFLIRGRLFLMNEVPLPVRPFGGAGEYSS